MASVLAALLAKNNAFVLTMLTVGLTTATNVKPPFVVMDKVFDPPSMNCKEVRRKLTCPFPNGPPILLYVGNVPTAALARFATDANERVRSIRAVNLAQAVAEYCAKMFRPV